MNAALRSSSGRILKLKPVEQTLLKPGNYAAVARYDCLFNDCRFCDHREPFVDRKYDVYRDQPVVGPITAMHLKHVDGDRRL
ncbi:hypothetical protein HGG75_11700 [Ochrobactrum pseudogrignonense]|nr:hypothetical protein [Brucella pseudogrignonensis]